MNFSEEKVNHWCNGKSRIRSVDKKQGNQKVFNILTRNGGRVL